MKSFIAQNQLLDTTIKFFTVSGTSLVILGGSLLAYYFISIGYFSNQISLSTNGPLIFFAIPFVFTGLVIFLSASLTSLGLSLRPLWHSLQSLVRWALGLFDPAKGNQNEELKFTIEPAKFHHLPFILFGLVIVVGYGFHDYKTFLQLIISCFGCALFFSTITQNNIKINKLESKRKTKKQAKKISQLKKHRNIMLTGLVIIPIFVGGVTTKLITATMSFTTIRNDAVTVHIKQPYADAIELEGIKGTNSIFGEDHKRFDNITVLVKGFGDELAIQTHSAKPFIIPKDHIVPM